MRDCNSYNYRKQLFIHDMKIYLHDKIGNTVPPSVVVD